MTLSSSCVQPLVSSGQPGDTKDEDYLVGSGILNESAVCSGSVRLFIIVNIFNIDIWGRVIKPILHQTEIFLKCCVFVFPRVTICLLLLKFPRASSSPVKTAAPADSPTGPPISSPPLQVFFIDPVPATSEEEAEMQAISLVAKLCPF